MSYFSRENSVQDGSPILLYQFVQGSQVWRYTSTAFPLTYLDQVWHPTQIIPGSVNQSSDMTRDTMSLKFPKGHEFARQFLGYTPDQMTTVTIFRGHTNDPDQQLIVYWKGRISSFKANKGELSVECEPIFTSLRRPGLRARWQKSCRHALYNRGCNLNPEDFRVQGLCTFASGVNITVPAASSYPNGWFTGGTVKAPDGTLRYIVDHSGSSLRLIRPIESLTKDVLECGYGIRYGELYGGPGVSLYPGCDHTLRMCMEKFDNGPRYGGFPWIPGKNPFGGSSIT